MDGSQALEAILRLRPRMSNQGQGEGVSEFLDVNRQCPPHERGAFSSHWPDGMPGIEGFDEHDCLVRTKFEGIDDLHILETSLLVKVVVLKPWLAGTIDIRTAAERFVPLAGPRHRNDDG